MNETNLIVVKQLPIIEENLKSISEEVQKRVKTAKNIVCTEDTLKSVKDLRADLNKEFKDLEAQRKATKDMIMKPYQDLDAIYKPLITEVFGQADEILKEKINTVENNLKSEKENIIKDYFNSLVTEKKLDSKYLKYEDLNLNITLSISNKKLCDEVLEKVEKVLNDIETINSMNDSEELLIEYIKTKDLNYSIKSVHERHELMNMIQQDKSPIERIVEEEVAIAEATEKEEQLTILEETNVKEELETYEFKVTCTISKAKELIEFLKVGGYIYE